MTSEKYNEFIDSITTSTLDGFSSEDVRKCLDIVRRAYVMQTALELLKEENRRAAALCHGDCAVCWERLNCITFMNRAIIMEGLNHGK